MPSETVYLPDDLHSKVTALVDARDYDNASKVVQAAVAEFDPEADQ